VAKADNPKGHLRREHQLVYHFSEHGQIPYDFSGHGNAAQNVGAADDAGMIGTGLLLTQDGGDLPPEPAWAEGRTVTWSPGSSLPPIQPNAVIFVVGQREGRLVRWTTARLVQVVGQDGTLRSTGGAPLAGRKWGPTSPSCDRRKNHPPALCDGAPYEP